MVDSISESDFLPSLSVNTEFFRETSLCAVHDRETGKMTPQYISSQIVWILI